MISLGYPRVTEKDMMLVLSLSSMREFMEGLCHCDYELDDTGMAMIENQGESIEGRHDVQLQVLLST